jgi:hypothetical protein
MDILRLALEEAAISNSYSLTDGLVNNATTASIVVELDGAEHRAVI